MTDTSTSLNDLRAQIAVALGWEERLVGPDAKGEHGGTKVLVPPTISDHDFIEMLPRIGAVSYTWFCHDWPTKYEYAEMLLKDMLAAGLHVQFEYAGKTVRVSVFEVFPDGTKLGVGNSPVVSLIYATTEKTFCLAVCKAWLGWRGQRK